MTTLDPSPTRPPRTRRPALDVPSALAATPDTQTIAAPAISLTDKVKSVLRAPGPTHLGLLVAVAAGLTVAAAGPSVPNWHGIADNFRAMAASLGLGPANANARAVVAPIQPLAISAVEVPPAQAFRLMSPEEALAWNTRVPLSSLPNPAAAAFQLAASDSIDGQRALDCLTATIYYEAGSEGAQGQRAVAQVVLNRLRHPAYPKTVCGVAFQGAELTTSCQFTYTCDGSMARAPSPEGWARARRVAEEALAGRVEKSVGWATHYHTLWVVPYWQAEVAKVATIGAHVFYRWDGGWTGPRTQAANYAGEEPDVVRLYGVGAAPFSQPRLQLAMLTAPAAPALEPVPEMVHVSAPEPARPVELLRPVEQVATIQPAPSAIVETQALAPPTGEIRKNRQVPLPGSW